MFGYFKAEAALGARLNDGAGENMMRGLLAGTSSAVSPGATSTDSSRAPPTVNVPVLSNSTDDFACPHQELVANDDGGYRHLFNALADAPMYLARRAIDQRTQIMLGAGNGDFLEHVAAGIHQCDNGAGERLTERQSRAHRYQRRSCGWPTATR
jgi:hypothetical protein